MAAALGFSVLDATALAARPAGKKTAKATTDSSSESSSVLARHFAKPPRNTMQSIKFVRVLDGQVLFQQNQDTRLSPASVTKLVTAAVALSRFGPAHTFTTRLVHSGQRRAGAIEGNLFAIGDGDPLLTSEKLWQAAADLRAMGIREIRGDIIVDNSLFDGESRDVSREEGAEASRNAYDAPVSAFAINFNTVAVTVSPGESAGSTARVSVDPVEMAGLRLESSVKTAAPGGQTKIAAVRIGSDGEEPVIRLSGTIALDSEPSKVYRSMVNPARLAGEYLRAFLKDAGISVSGKVKAGRASGSEHPLLSLPSYDMRRIVGGLNTFSNNFIGDMVTKRLAAGQARPGSLDSGARVLRDYLRKDVGLSDGFVIENGSGLATENRLSAGDVVRLLQHVEKDMTIFPDFLASLPSYGWDGSLQKRMKGSDRDRIGALVRAKSGTLSEPVSVSGLAGYLKHPSEGMVAFAIIMNGVPGKPQPGIGSLRAMQDSALADFLERGQN
jgi:D-alanyl-D-alanine carboxypeptidase/D-alanyl-D-alanine-endopeptidase (penicillin-binding protein 4)